jgi:tetratricopeptide (TPR) repeat protein
MATNAASARKLWIISPLWDTLFLIGTPLVLIPTVITLGRQLSSLDLSLLVVLFATGHQLPTFLRTYADRDLWNRYRVRLILLPLLLLVTLTFYTRMGWAGIGLILLLWSPWHGAMQLYGFMRIYDAKRGQVSSLAARLDWLLCTFGFLTILLWSHNYTYNVGTEVFSCGLPIPPAAWFLSARLAITAAAALIALAYLVHGAWLLGQGQPVSPLKLVLLLTSLATYYFAFDLSPDPVVGIAAWEIFHDIQYFAIVWAYNRRLVETGQSGTRVLKFLFRPRLALIGIYAGLLFGYGVLDLGTSFLPQDLLGVAARNVFLISTLLHFYYDGFIWKVRRRDTRKYLDVVETSDSAGALEPAPAPRVWPGELRQVAYVMAPLLLLGFTQQAYQPSPERTHHVLASLVPNAEARHALGRSYQEQAETLQQLVRGYDEAGDVDRAEEQRRRADDYYDRAIREYRNALELDSDYPAANDDLGNLLVRRGRLKEGIAHLEKALARARDGTWLATRIGDRRNPFRAEARARVHHQLGVAYQQLGRTDEAEAHLRQAADVPQSFVALRQTIAGDLAKLLEQQRRYEEAIRVLRDGVAAGPDGQWFLSLRLAQLLATCPDPQQRDPREATALAHQVCEATQFQQPDALETLAQCYEAFQRPQEARRVLVQLVRLCQMQGDSQRLQRSRRLLERFSAERT